MRFNHTGLLIGWMALLTVIIWPADGLAAEKPANMPGHYPPKFSFTGCIQKITSQQAVIGDVLLKFAPAATFNTPKEQDTSRSRFRVGRMVGVMLNSKHMIESLWDLEKECNDRRVTPSK